MKFLPPAESVFFWALFLCTFISFGLNGAMSIAHANPVKSATPQAVMFYPNEVQLFVEEKLNIVTLPSGATGILLTLPASANEESFLATVGDVSINNFTFLRLQPPIVPYAEKALLSEHEQNPERKKILQAIELAENQKTGSDAELALLRSRWSLWTENSEAKLLANVAERIVLEAELIKNVPTLIAQIAEAEKKGKYINNELAQHKNKLALFDQHNTYVEVALKLNPEELEIIKNSAQKNIQYNYTMLGGYSSSYRLFAKPVDKTLTLDYYAVLRHNFGEVWNNVDVSLSTFNRTRPVQPALPDYWNIDFYKGALKAPPASAPVSMAIMDMAAGSSESERDVARKEYKASAPVETESGIARVWQLGKQTLAHNEDNRILLSSQKHVAEYAYLLRPQKTKYAYLTAKLNLENALELPPGVAQLVVDGTITGIQNFSFYGTTGEIYFGQDPQISATITNLESKKGQQGFISKEQTYAWHWEMKIKNQKKEAVLVHVEDSDPEVMDERIKLTITSTPTPVKEELIRHNLNQKILRWVLPLAAGEEKIIHHKVQISAPENETVNLGRNLEQ